VKILGIEEERVGEGFLLKWRGRVKVFAIDEDEAIIHFLSE